MEEGDEKVRRGGDVREEEVEEGWREGGRERDGECICKYVCT